MTRILSFVLLYAVTVLTVYGYAYQRGMRYGIDSATRYLHSQIKRYLGMEAFLSYGKQALAECDRRLAKLKGKVQS